MGQLINRVLEHLPLLLRVGRRMTRNDAEAEDLAQETLIRAMDRTGELREPARMRGWLLAVQRRVFLNSRRGLRARFELLEGGLSSREPTADLEEELLRDTIDDDLHRALEALPAEWREALWMREVDELSYAEIAEAQRCPVGTVRSRLARARDAMQRSLSVEVARVRMQR